MGKLLLKYIWGNAEPETVLENAEISEIRQIIQTRSPSGLARYIDIKREVGKRNLSSIGSENMKKCEYLSKTQLWDFDFFFIVFDTVLHEDDLWLAQQSKVDLDIELGCGEDARSIIKNLREGTLSTINKIEVLQSNIGVCFISSINEDIAEMAKIKNHINHNLKSKRYETILYSLNGLSKEIIKTKYISLKKRILFVTAAVGIISATHLSGIEFGINIAILAWELYHYINVLGLCRKEMKSLINAEDSQVKWSEVEKTRWKLVRYILHQSPKLIALIAVAAMQNKFGIFGSTVGTVVTFAVSGPITYSFLINNLDNFTHESIISYDRVVSRHVPKTLRYVPCYNCIDKVLFACHDTINQ
ncbi:unnamed protein product [Mytilus coruscus]|uniref:Uncharacterized protein n=1 Tax=Mytilus coruscus TaxID=42192 RepID=A0A6J8BFJ0_MYTCO|nr:unnamed protein product [Mytilus coruscus]